MSDINKFEWFGHHKLLRIITISGIMVNEEPIRVGAGLSKATFGPTDLTVLKVVKADGKELPVVPGSSFKGMLRATCIYMLRALGLNVCDGIVKATCLTGNEFNEIEERKLSAEMEVTEKIKQIVNATVGKEKRHVCPLCLLFGAPGLASHIEFMDSYPISDFKLGYRTCVAIDRRKGSSARRSLFTVEYVEPDCRWNFEFKVENVPNYLLGLVLDAIELVNAGLIKLGGMKSRGFGKIKIELDKVSIFSLNHRQYGIVDGKLQPLDPIDKPVNWSGTLKELTAETEGKDAKKFIENLRTTWHSSLTELRKCHKNGKWIWMEALKDVNT